MRRATSRFRPCTRTWTFLSTLSLRRATRAALCAASAAQFLSTLSLRRATQQRSGCFRKREISIHALLAESDLSWTLLLMPLRVFLSTLSLRRATHAPGFFTPFQIKISIHALLAESDLFAVKQPRNCRQNFYPRSPCGERPARRCAPRQLLNFYPRSPCGERPPAARHTMMPFSFLSTLSLRRATPVSNCCLKLWRISIHALLAESDAVPRLPMAALPHFYPRSPCGERPGSLAEVAKYATISIHALLAESDTQKGQNLSDMEISIHALLAESDWRRIRVGQLHRNFYPRSPCGERRL